MIAYFKPFTCLLFLLSIQMAIAQSSKNKLTCSFSSLHPILSFSDYSASNEKSGAASNGLGVNLGYERFLKSKISIVGQLYYYKNPINIPQIEHLYNQKTYFVFDKPYNLSPWTFTKTSWTIKGLNFGFNKFFSLNEKNSLLFSLTPLIGIAYVSSPELKGESNTSTTKANFSQNSETKATTFLQFKSGLHYMINKNMNVELAVSYLASKNFTYSNLIENFAAIITQDNSTIALSDSHPKSVNLKVDLITISFGLGYFF